VPGDIETVRGWYALGAAGRFDADTLRYWYDEVWHPDIDWRAVEGAPDDSGVMRGRERVRKYFEELLEAFDDLVAEPLEFTEVGDHVLVDVRLTGRSRGGGVPTELRFSVTCLVKDGKLASGREYLSHDDAVAAAGR
jgi:ketosteroid isomerase-like protein